MYPLASRWNACIGSVLIAVGLSVGSFVAAQEPGGRSNFESRPEAAEDTVRPQDLLTAFERVVPAEASSLDVEASSAVRRSATRLEAWAAEIARQNRNRPPAKVLRDIERLVAAHQQVQRLGRRFLKLRRQLSDGPQAGLQRKRIRSFLLIADQLIDLSGRLRYVLRDAVDAASYELDPHPAEFLELIKLLAKHRVSIGAAALSYVLFDPPTESPAVPFSPEVKFEVLRLIAATRSSDLLVELAEFLRQPDQVPELVVMAADVVWYIGVPQTPHPDSDPTLPPPPITAQELLEILRTPRIQQAEGEIGKRRGELLDLLQQRTTEGITGAAFHYGHLRLKSGDWLLMKNPSPYNRFTDLAPGLFTHVGVVTTETGDDGVRRFLIVDLPERGDQVPVTTVDQYLDRTLHYFFVRHPEDQVAAKMGDVARQLIGRTTQFDLTFQTEHVASYRGRLDETDRLHTYCAGFLLVCAQETSANVEEFFPIREYPSSEQCVSNLQQLGMAIGDDFISPTGALFSRKLEIVGAREPMYDPGREITQGIYDYFAQGMKDRKLHLSLNTTQALRAKVASLSQFNPWLARALARANNVSEHMDLESAARAAAVIETLDEIAETKAAEFFEALETLLAVEEPEAPGAEQPESLRKYLQRHSDLKQRWLTNQLTPRQLRQELVRYYLQQGFGQVDQQFFQSQEKP